MVSNSRDLTGSYQYCLAEIKRLMQNMEKALDRYAEKADASETYLDIENDRMQIIADYINISEQLFDYQIENFIHKDEHAQQIKEIHKKYELLFDPDFWERINKNNAVSKQAYLLPAFLRQEI